VKTLSAHTAREELTVPQIAAEAGVTPSTIYRRWGDLSALLADVATECLRPISDPDDTGNVVSDLRVFVEKFMEEMSSDVGRGLMSDVLASMSNEARSSQCANYTIDTLTVIAERAKARGDAVFKVEDVMDLVIAPIIYNILFGVQPLTVEYCRRLLDRVQFV
jgi:AcrR family transcriptional regulator